MLPEATARGADPEPRKCRLRTSKRNFIEREALGYPQTVSVTEGEHPPGGRPGHSVHPYSSPTAVRTDIAMDSEGWPLLVKLAPAAEAKASTSSPSAEEAMARGCRAMTAHTSTPSAASPSSSPITA